MIERTREQRPRARRRERHRLGRHRAHQRVGHDGDEARGSRAGRRCAAPRRAIRRHRRADCRIVTRLTSAELMARTSARSCRRLPAATTHVPGGSACSPRRRSSSKRIERLLHVGRAGRQFVEEQAERLGALGQQDARRTEHRALADDARNTAHILRRDLRSSSERHGRPASRAAS